MDIKHTPELTATGGACVNCGIEIPIDIVAYGDEVIEMGGAGVHWIPGFAYDGKAKDCIKAKRRGATVLVCVICEGKGCDQCNEGLVASDGSTPEVKQAKPGRKEVIERAPSKTEFEKATARMAFNNFQAMREATKPDEQ
jgi:hypothetical protein